jgi:hypothetical protein
MRKIVRPEWSIESKQVECNLEYCTAMTCYECTLDYDDSAENSTVNAKLEEMLTNLLEGNER